MRHATIIASIGLLGGCALERLKDEFYMTEPPEATTTADTGAASTADETSGSGSTSAPASTSGTDTATGSDGSTGSSEATSDESTTTSEPATSTSTGPASVCGDGVVEGDEECEDMLEVNCFNCFRDRLVFVTLEIYQGDWATSGYLYPCNHLADLAGLLTNHQTRFEPWVSTSEGSPADRLFHSPGRYVMVNGLVFAESWDDIVAGNILNALEVDENSQTRVWPVWTDTRPDSTAITAEDGDHCGDWTVSSFGSWAYYGGSDEVDGGWTLHVNDVTNPQPCDSESALYCFEFQ